MSRSRSLTSSPNTATLVPQEKQEKAWDSLLEEVFRDHQNELFATLYYLLGNQEDARDAVQEAFLRCWKNREQLPTIENLKAWVFRIALNIGRDVRKSAWNRKKKELVEESASFISGREPSPENNALEREKIQQLRTAIAELDDSEKEVFLLRENGQFTYAQIAETLEIPEGTVKTRMRRAIANLSDKLVGW